MHNSHIFACLYDMLQAVPHLYGHHPFLFFCRFTAARHGFAHGNAPDDANPVFHTPQPVSHRVLALRYSVDMPAGSDADVDSPDSCKTCV